MNISSYISSKNVFFCRHRWTAFGWKLRVGLEGSINPRTFSSRRCFICLSRRRWGGTGAFSEVGAEDNCVFLLRGDSFCPLLLRFPAWETSQPQKWAVWTRTKNHLVSKISISLSVSERRRFIHNCSQQKFLKICHYCLFCVKTTHVAT